MLAYRGFSYIQTMQTARSILRNFLWNKKQTNKNHVNKNCTFSQKSKYKFVMYQRTVGDAGPYNSSIFNLIFCISLKLTILPLGGRLSCSPIITQIGRENNVSANFYVSAISPLRTTEKSRGFFVAAEMLPALIRALYRGFSRAFYDCFLIFLFIHKLD